MTEERMISPKLREEEVALDVSLRPRRLADFIGQDRIKENLRIVIEAAKKRGEALDHVLLYGPPGLGKTTLAHCVANEMGVNIKVTAGPAIERAGDLAAILTNLRQGDVLFIDEVHRLGRAIEETLWRISRWTSSSARGPAPVASVSGCPVSPLLGPPPGWP